MSLLHREAIRAKNTAISGQERPNAIRELHRCARLRSN